MKPRILDLFCGAGGSAMGLHQAGFEVVGVDIKPQPHYPFEFHQGDALTYPLDGFDAYWASPPCQAYTPAANEWRKKGREYPDLIATTRERLRATGKPYVIENVPRSPLLNPIKLNGATFGLLLQRVRWFECSFDMPLFLLAEGKKPIKMGRPTTENDVIQPCGHFPNRKHAERQMGIDWMTKQELTQAIPPAYSRFIGEQLMKVIRPGVLASE